jgi:homoserine O-acetyltransferase/O-succinyltransferase
MIPRIRSLTFVSAILTASFVFAADYPTPTEGDYVVRDFKFTSGETLPELRLRYRTLGKPEKDAQGKTTNAVLIMHGTTGSGAQFIRPEFAGDLFGKDQPLDATKFFIVLPDAIGHGKSSKPSDDTHAKFPRYGYIDMVEADLIDYEVFGEHHLAHAPGAVRFSKATAPAKSGGKGMSWIAH